MKSIVTSVFAALLFIALTPGVLLRLPPKGGKWTVLLVHALVYFLIYFLFHGMVNKMFNPGFRQGFGNKNKIEQFMLKQRDIQAFQNKKEPFMDNVLKQKK